MENVRGNVPLFLMVESHVPFGAQVPPGQLPEVVEWVPPAHCQVTVSPTLIVVVLVWLTESVKRVLVRVDRGVRRFGDACGEQQAGRDGCQNEGPARSENWGTHVLLLVSDDTVPAYGMRRPACALSSSLNRRAAGRPRGTRIAAAAI